MELPEYLYVENKEIPGIGLILSTKPPYNMGRPIRFEDKEAFDHFVKKYDLINKFGSVEPYNILIVWIGTINNIADVIPSGNSITDSIIIDLKKMTIFYDKEKVRGNESRLKKYLKQ